jgi:alanyl-tRNA synthetase
MLTSDDIRRSYIDFFTRRGHTEIPGASLVGDAGTLFTVAGMQPLIPYFSGAPHPAGGRLVDHQRCLRTVDIDEVGDASHLTCFEMLGNWSLGDYFKHESLGWTLEWLTEVLGIDRGRLAVSVFAGDEQVPLDVEARDRWLELGNNVFIAYEQTPDGVLRPLAQRNVDVGLGLERITSLLQGAGSVYETDLFTPVTETIRGLATAGDVRAERIVADHVRSGVLLIGDGVLPSNTEQGYVLRRLLRRAIRQARVLGINGPCLREVGRSVLDRYRTVYPHLGEGILDVLESAERRFAHTLRRGLRELRRLEHVDGRELFRLFETYGLPPELTLEELGADIDGWREGFDRAADEHRELSRSDRGGEP